MDQFGYIMHICMYAQVHVHVCWCLKGHACMISEQKKIKCRKAVRNMPDSAKLCRD